MFKVVDVKPRSGFVTDNKPSLSGVIDVLPRIARVYDEVIRWKPTGRGMAMGLLLALTYPTDEKI